MSKPLFCFFIVCFLRTDYIPYTVTHRPEKQQLEYKPKSGEIDLGTTYKQDFNPYELQPFTPLRPKERVHVVNAKLDTVPTYKGKNMMLCEHVSEYTLNN